MSTNGSYFLGQTPATGASFNNNSSSGNFSSNNPFRNRATSPASVDAAFASSPSSPFDDPPPPPRPLSRNPFLDNPPAPARTSDIPSARSNTRSLTAEDIFGSLTLDDKPATMNKPTSPSPSQQGPADRPLPPRQGGENQPPRPAESRHRPTRSQEEALRARKPPPANPRPGPSDNSPQQKQQRRPRRNSDSSVMDFDAKPLTEEEKKMIEGKRRERERRGKEKGKSGRPSRKMDIIDKLDATSIYGTGLFHHDGPFDALNPHRNRQNSRRLAPMQAFPKDSLNNTMGGPGPLNAQADHSTFMGHATEEAFSDFATSGKNKNGYNYPSSSRGQPAIFDPTSRGGMVHGDESIGLGTSTFLEGTPAARSTIVRRQAEEAQEIAEGGLQRKKSLAQRIRHINKGPRGGDYSPSGQGRYGTSAGSESNPYFGDYKGEESISVTKPREGRFSPPPPMPRRGSGGTLERRATTDALNEEGPAKSSGLLGRMKSLKGGRRTGRNAENAAGMGA